ncbi:MAG TPA: dihydrofolate reductase [Azospirillum sp.]|nr:dihydrofolate reductase [Azospirillum sp.]
MRISLVVAAARNGVIGRNGALPWHLPGDLKRFKELTLGKPTLMGRRTWDSLPRRPLPGRKNIVLSRGAEPGPHAGALWFRNLTAAIDHARSSGAEELCVIGGAQVFAEALPLADALYLTAVEQDVAGDTFMPPLGDRWVEVRSTPVQHENGLAFRYVDYERIREGA